MDQNGRPVCSEMWPGNTTDVITLIPVIDRLRQRFAVGRVCIVADRGMISAETIANLEDRGLEYILGVRERSSKEVYEVVLNDPKPSVSLIIPRGQRRDTELEVKNVGSATAATWSAATSTKPSAMPRCARRCCAACARPA